jgi:hypothetical protein
MPAGKHVAAVARIWQHPVSAPKQKLGQVRGGRQQVRVPGGQKGKEQAAGRQGSATVVKECAC